MRLVHPVEGTIVSCDGALADSLLSRGWVDAEAVPAVEESEKPSAKRGRPKKAE